MLLSLILPSFCRAELLSFGLWSISNLNLEIPLEIIVLNDGVELDDGTEAICKYYSYFLNIRYIFTGHRNIHEKKWRVPGFAINIGVKQAKGDIIILSNPEIFHLVDNFTLALNMLKADTFVSPGYIYFDDDNLILSKLQQDKYTKFTFTDEQLETACSNEGKNRTATRMPFFTMMYKSAFMNINGYDETFTGYAADDNDFMDRIMINNRWVKCLDIRLIHLYHGNSNSGIAHPDNPAWVYNYNLWQKNKQEGVAVVNVGKKWGEI